MKSNTDTLFNTPEGKEFIGIQTDTAFGKAKKGSPEYEEWLRKYREKRGGKSKAEEAKEKREARDVLTKEEREKYEKLRNQEKNADEKFHSYLNEAKDKIKELPEDFDSHVLEIQGEKVKVEKVKMNQKERAEAKVYLNDPTPGRSLEVVKFSSSKGDAYCMADRLSYDGGYMIMDVTDKGTRIRKNDRNASKRVRNHMSETDMLKKEHDRNVEEFKQRRERAVERGKVNATPSEVLHIASSIFDSYNFKEAGSKMFDGPNGTKIELSTEEIPRGKSSKIYSTTTKINGKEVKDLNIRITDKGFTSLANKAQFRRSMKQFFEQESSKQNLQ